MFLKQVETKGVLFGPKKEGGLFIIHSKVYGENNVCISASQVSFEKKSVLATQGRKTMQGKILQMAGP